jgi:CubicO group peptidase (beta-lactamase class C family)
VLGSITKSITALAAMQLVEAGKVGLDDAVQRHLPWFPGTIFTRSTGTASVRAACGDPPVPKIQFQMPSNTRRR